MGGRPLPLMTLLRLPHLSGLRSVVPKLLKELQKVEAVNPQTCTYLLIARLCEPRRPGVCVCVSRLSHVRLLATL